MYVVLCKNQNKNIFKINSLLKSLKGRRAQYYAHFVQMSAESVFLIYLIYYSLMLVGRHFMWVDQKSGRHLKNDVSKWKSGRVATGVKKCDFQI
jgi:hypothetical protein